eukprot:Sspe_Gene.109152::Locus_88601_Transcript_1_1_Confidence_1.000_Length_2436::g.109152::m.109152
MGLAGAVVVLLLGAAQCDGGSVWWEWWPTDEHCKVGDQDDVIHHEWITDRECLHSAILQDGDPLRKLPQEVIGSQSVKDYDVMIFCADESGETDKLSSVEDDLVFVRLFNTTDASCGGSLLAEVILNSTTCTNHSTFRSFDGARFHCTRCRWLFMGESAPPYFMQAVGVLIFLLFCIMINFFLQDRVDRWTKLLPSVFAKPDPAEATDAVFPGVLVMLQTVVPRELRSDPPQATAASPPAALPPLSDQTIHRPNPAPPPQAHAQPASPSIEDDDTTRRSSSSFGNSGKYYRRYVLDDDATRVSPSPANMLYSPPQRGLRVRPGYPPPRPAPLVLTPLSARDEDELRASPPVPPPVGSSSVSSLPPPRRMGSVDAGMSRRGDGYGRGRLAPLSPVTPLTPVSRKYSGPTYVNTDDPDPYPHWGYHDVVRKPSAVDFSSVPTTPDLSPGYLEHRSMHQPELPLLGKEIVEMVSVDTESTMCVVCGREDREKVVRSMGPKCKECVGKGHSEDLLLRFEDQDTNLAVYALAGAFGEFASVRGMATFRGVSHSLVFFYNSRFWVQSQSLVRFERKLQRTPLEGDTGPVVRVEDPLLEELVLRHCELDGFFITHYCNVEGERWTAVELLGKIAVWLPTEVLTRVACCGGEYVRVKEKGVVQKVAGERWKDWWKEFELCVGKVVRVIKVPVGKTYAVEAVVKFKGSATITFPIEVLSRCSEKEHDAEYLITPQKVEKRTMMAVFVASAPPLLAAKGLYLMVYFGYSVRTAFSDGHSGRANNHNTWEAYEEVYFKLFNSG